MTLATAYCKEKEFGKC